MCIRDSYYVASSISDPTKNYFSAPSVKSLLYLVNSVLQSCWNIFVRLRRTIRPLITENCLFHHNPICYYYFWLWIWLERYPFYTEPWILKFAVPSDYHISTGMNTEKFKYKWGGEDWDLLDRIINLSLEVERIKYPGLYHHYHTKKKNWGWTVG